MIRRMTVGLLAVALAGLAVAQEPGEGPPIRLKKKARPAAEQKAPDAPPAPPAGPPPAPEPRPADKPGSKERLQRDKDDAEPAVPEGPEEGEDEVLHRIGKNMRAVEDRLANREVNDRTRQVQEDILKDLDALIDRMRNGGQSPDNQQDQQQQSNPGGGQQQARNRPRGGQQQPGMGSRRQRGRRQMARGQQQARPGQQAGRQQQQPNPGQQQQARADSAGDRPGMGGRSQGEMNKLAEIYKDVWGHLPETLRPEIDAYSRERFMARYNDLIRQYYITVAEKSRRKE